MDRPQFSPYVYTWLVSAIAALFKGQAFFFLIALTSLHLFGQEISIKQIELEGGHDRAWMNLDD